MNDELSNSEMEIKENEAYNNISIRNVDLTKIVKIDSILRKAVLYIPILSTAFILLPFIDYVSGYYTIQLLADELDIPCLFVGIVLFSLSFTTCKKLRYAYLSSLIYFIILTPSLLILILNFIISFTQQEFPIGTYFIIFFTVIFIYLAIPIYRGLIAFFLARKAKVVAGEVNALECLRYQTKSPPLSWNFKKLSSSIGYYSLPFLIFILISILMMGLNLHPALSILSSTIIFMFSSIWFWDKAKRVRLITTEEARKRDKRPPALLLRSFKDDVLKIKPPLFSNKIIKENSFEEIIADQLWAKGPVIAIGRPGEKTPPVGAARSYYSDEEWQKYAEIMVKESKSISMIVGMTEGLGWEIRRILKLKIFSKLLLIFPPVPKDESVHRWEGFLSHIKDKRLVNVLRKSSAEKMMLICFSNIEELIVFYAQERRDPLAYHLAIAASNQLLNKS